MSRKFSTGVNLQLIEPHWTLIQPTLTNYNDAALIKSSLHLKRPFRSKIAENDLIMRNLLVKRVQWHEIGAETLARITNILIVKLEQRSIRV